VLEGEREITEIAVHHHVTNTPKMSHFVPRFEAQGLFTWHSVVSDQFRCLYRVRFLAKHTLPITSGCVFGRGWHRGFSGPLKRWHWCLLHMSEENCRYTPHNILVCQVVRYQCLPHTREIQGKFGVLVTKIEGPSWLVGKCWTNLWVKFWGG